MRSKGSSYILAFVCVVCGFSLVMQGYAGPEDPVAVIHMVINDVLIDYGFNVLDAAVTETGMHQFNVVSRDSGEEFVLSGTASLKNVSPLRSTLSNAQRLDVSLMDETGVLQIWITQKLETTGDGKRIYSQLTASLMRDGTIPINGILVENVTKRIVAGDTTLGEISSYLEGAEIGSRVELEFWTQKTKGSNRSYTLCREMAVKESERILVWESETHIVDPDAFIATTVKESWTSCVGDCQTPTTPGLNDYQLTITYYGFDLTTSTVVSSTTKYSLAEVLVESLASSPDRTILQTVYGLEDSVSGERLSLEGTLETTIIGNQIKKVLKQSVWRNGEQLHSETVLIAIDPLPLKLVLVYLVLFCAEHPNWCAHAVYHGVKHGGRFLLEQGMLAYGRFIKAEEAGDPTRTCDVKADILTCRGPEAMAALQQNCSLELGPGGEAVLREKPVIEPPEALYVGYWRGSLTFKGTSYSISMRVLGYDQATGALSISSTSIGGKNVTPPAGVTISGSAVTFQSPWVGVTGNISRSTITGTINLGNINLFGILSGPGSGTWWMSKR